jgi:hypothetical protein
MQLNEPHPFYLNESPLDGEIEAVINQRATRRNLLEKTATWFLVDPKMEFGLCSFYTPYKRSVRYETQQPATIIRQTKVYRIAIPPVGNHKIHSSSGAIETPTLKLGQVTQK